MARLSLLVGLGLCAALPAGAGELPGPYSVREPDRWAKVAALIPGRNVPRLTPETLFAEWTRQQAERWSAAHPQPATEQTYQTYAAAEPTDTALTADFPRHITPYGRVKSGRIDQALADRVLIGYCPFCGSRSFALTFDPANAYHATTRCCRTELYGRAADCPPAYPLKPTTTVRFRHLDDSFVEVPCTVYTDRNQVTWELFLKAIFDQRRWLQVGGSLVRELRNKFLDTGDPVYVHKLAVLLDEVAETYYGLPLCDGNELCGGQDGQGLTRAEWEAVPRPAIFQVGALGPWNRRTPIFNRGWINMSDEHIWVEPFARVRHHPTFKDYSRRKYGDPEALDRRIMTRVMRELVLMFKSVFAQKLFNNYQEANYVDLMLLGVLTGDKVLLDFAVPAQEVAMYNHSYQDGLNGEGAPNYMSMPGGYFYPFLADPTGWLQYYPTFLDEHPFYHAANGELRKLRTVRGMQVEFGDQHEYAFPRNLSTDPAQVRANERVGSRNWAGYGVGILRVGGAGHRQEVQVSYPRAFLHNSRDALTIECWVDGVPVMRRGGYVSTGQSAWLQWDRPEFQALRKMGYPHDIQDAHDFPGTTARAFAHTPICHNGVTVDEVATGPGWGDNRGYGEVLCYKGGEPAGEPGSGFQVLEVLDHYSWERVGQQVDDFRRALLGVEGPDGRPYFVDLLKLVGGARHALYNSAWAERTAARLPAAKAKAADLTEVFFAGKLPQDTPDYHNYKYVRDITRHAPADGWELTWRTDLNAYAPRDSQTNRPGTTLPDGIGAVELRVIAPLADDRTELLSGKAPWIGRITQPLPGGHIVDGDVAFRGARDTLVEVRRGAAGQPLSSLFCHVLEGYRAGEPSAIRAVQALAPTAVDGPRRDLVALRLEFVAGHSDTVVYQSEPGTVRLPDGSETDARYALIRRDAQGGVMAIDAVRGRFVQTGEFRAELPGEFTGEVVDLVGDLTGTRRQSAVIVKPDRPWPAGAGLRDRQLLVRVESALREPCGEGYRVDQVTALPGGLVRVDVQDHAPFVVSWHEVTELPADRPNVVKTWRPMVDHGSTPWYDGLKVAFPERGRVYTIKQTSEVGGGWGGETLELTDGVNLAADGIRVGDWYVIYGIEPGQKVLVANDFSWRREEAGPWRQHALRATGAVTVRCPATAEALWYRAGEGAWAQSPGGRTSFPAAASGGAVRLIGGKPDWLDLADTAPPKVLRIAIDGLEVAAEQAAELGWIEPPRRLEVTFADDHSILAEDRLVLLWNGRPLGADGITVTAADGGRRLTIAVTIAAALKDQAAQPRQNRLELTVEERSADRRRATAVVGWLTKVALDPQAVYLSDLKPVRATAHGGLIADRDYTGKPAAIRRQVHARCLTLCPARSLQGGRGEVVYELPAARELTFLADIGLSDSSGGRGSVIFQVEVGDQPDGPWRRLYQSPIVRGVDVALALELPLGRAKYLRLATGDAGDDINSDHALWGSARLR